MDLLAAKAEAPPSETARQRLFSNHARWPHVREERACSKADQNAGREFELRGSMAPELLDVLATEIAGE